MAAVMAGSEGKRAAGIQWILIYIREGQRGCGRRPAERSEIQWMQQGLRPMSNLQCRFACNANSTL